MKKHFLLRFCKEVLVFIILFIILQVFDRFVYKTDPISVLFGIFYLAFGVKIQYFLKYILERIEIKLFIRHIDKIMQEWEDTYTDESE